MSNQARVTAARNVVITTQSLVRDTVLRLLYASSAFKEYHLAGEGILLDVARQASRDAIHSLSTLSLFIRNIQDEEANYKQEVGFLVGHVSESERKQFNAKSIAPEARREKLALRDILNRFAHSTENTHRYRVDGCNHVMLIGFNGKMKFKDHGYCIAEFSVTDFCQACLKTVETQA